MPFNAHKLGFGHVSTRVAPAGHPNWLKTTRIGHLAKFISIKLIGVQPPAEHRCSKSGPATNAAPLG